MTNLEYIAQALEIALGSILIIKLLNLRLHLVYRLFSFFLVVELAGSVTWLAQRFLAYQTLQLDYRVVWVAERSLVWSLIVPTVYVLLGAVLRTLPGILSFSRRYLNLTFVAATLIAALSAAWEYRKSGYGAYQPWQDQLLFAGILVDRLVSSVVLIAIVGILCFLLWFPVQIPRNLAVFTVGFAVYAAGSTTSLLFQSLLVHQTSRPISTAIELLTSACFAYWALFITPAGEKSPARINVPRSAQEQARLIRSLELLNESLLRSAGR